MELNNTIASSITGGDSFCFLEIAATGGPMIDNPQILAMHQGKFPVYDVFFQIKDQDKVEAVIKSESAWKDGLIIEHLNENSISFNVGTCTPGLVKMLRRLSLGSGKERRFTVTITARNGLYNQSISCKRINGAWKIASKVTHLNGVNRVTLHERIDPGFPKNSIGQIDW